MTFKKKSPQELVCLSESGHLFQCLLQLKYTKILSLIYFTSKQKLLMRSLSQSMKSDGEVTS